jgi:hypothetical protein
MDLPESVGEYVDAHFVIKEFALDNSQFSEYIQNKGTP